MMKKRQKPKTLRPVHPNAGIRAWYRKKLLALVEEMFHSYAFAIERAYKANPPKIAQDALPSRELERVIRRLSIRWRKNFDEAAKQLAGYFATKVDRRSAATLRKILKDGGWTVEMKITPALRDVINASVSENVALIKSIPEQFHTQVQGMVMRSVTAGRDLAPLYRSIRRQYGVTRRRAELIARDQNNKATASITRARYVDLGIKEAVWLHSSGGKTKRPTHVANSGKRFDIAKGWYDPDPKVKQFIQPGTLINCRCVCKPIVKGFS